MEFGPSLNDERINEKIGLLTTQATYDLLRSSFVHSPCSFISHDNFGSLIGWARTEKPRLVIFEARAFASSLNAEGMEDFGNSIKALNVPALVLTRSVEEGKKLNKKILPNTHFYHGPVNGQHLKKRIHDILDEVSFPSRPVVAVFSEHPFLLCHLEFLLKNYGARMMAVSSFKGGADGDAMSVGRADCCLWDVTSGIWSKESVLRFLRQVRGDPPPPIIQVAESWQASSDKNENNHSTPVFTLNNTAQLVMEMVSVFRKTKNIQLKLCRDNNTGFYLPEVFVELGEREMALSNRSGEPFSILRIYLGNVESVESHYGAIFVKELEMNLGLFVQSRVRSSDLVAKGGKGEILLLLSALPRELALLVGERLRHTFSKEASFREKSTQVFDPRLDYEIYTYPHDIHSVEDINKFVQGNLPHPIRPPLDRWVQE